MTHTPQHHGSHTTPPQMDPGSFLHQFSDAHGVSIRYDADAGFGDGGAAQVVRVMKAAAATRTWNEDSEEFDYITYETPGYVIKSGTPGPNDSHALATEQAAHEHFDKALATGDLAAVHAATDKFNAARMAIPGRGPFRPPSDWDILKHRTDEAGAGIKNIETLRVTDAADRPVGCCIPWFDTEAADKALKAYELP